MKPARQLLPVWLLLFVLVPVTAFASPGSEPLIGFGSKVLDFLTGTFAEIVVMIGLVIAAISVVMGSREGMQKAVFAIIGGALIFSVHTIVNFIHAAAQ